MSNVIQFPGGYEPDHDDEWYGYHSLLAEEMAEAEAMRTPAPAPTPIRVTVSIPDLPSPPEPSPVAGILWFLVSGLIAFLVVGALL